MAVNSNPPVQLDPSQDQGHQIAFINQNFQSLANSLNPYILSDGTNNRLLIGKDSTGSYVVKVSKAGFDAFDADAANLIFSSSQDVFKIVSKNIVSFTPAATENQTIVVAHGLSFIPVVMGFYTPGTGSYNPLPHIIINNTGTVSFLVRAIQSTATNLLFYLEAPGSTVAAATGQIGFTYYILQETVTA